jgi:hypothetical protein
VPGGGWIWALVPGAVMPNGERLRSVVSDAPGVDGQAIAIPPEVCELLEAPNYVHLSTLRASGSTRNEVVSGWSRRDPIPIAVTWTRSR